MSLCSNVVTMLSIRQPGLFGSSHRWIRGLRVSMTGVICGTGTLISLLLDCASGVLSLELLSVTIGSPASGSSISMELLDGATLEEDSSYGGRMPASGGCSIEELLGFSTDDEEMIIGVPDRGAIEELLRGCIADESASMASLLRRSPLEEMSV